MLISYSIFNIFIVICERHSHEKQTIRRVTKVLFHPNSGRTVLQRGTGGGECKVNPSWVPSSPTLMNKRTLGMLALVLLVVGGLNWGLISVMEYDVVAALFGAMSVVSRVVYGLVGLAAVYIVIGWVAKMAGPKA